MMIEDRIPDDKSELIVEPAHVEVVFTEGRGSVLSVQMPPIEDIAEMDRLKFAQFSIGEVASRDLAMSESAFVVELAEQLKKQAVHGYSAVFNNRLANLAQLAGDRELEEKFLRKAIELSDEGFFFNRLGENLISRERFIDAEKLFSERDLEKDLHANLRLAFFHVKRSDFDAASKVLNRAVVIDPLDYSSRLFQGSLSLVAGDPSSAIRAFRIAGEARPNSSVLHTNFSIAYASQGNYERALGFAKRAVALDPLNKNALGLLADLAFRQKCNEDAIPALRYFLEFEQKQPQIWAQLARALLEIGSFDEAISALRRQGSLVDSPEVWNNLGVAYHRRGKTTAQKALEAFAYAANNKWNANERVPAVALRNFCAMLAVQGAHDRIIATTKAAFQNNELVRLALHDSEISDLFVFRILSLMHTGQREEAMDLAESLLDSRDSISSLRAWVAAWAIAFYALREDPRALILSDRFVGLFWDTEVKKAGRADMLINNIAFAYAELGNLARADDYLKLVSNRIHKDPYPTATLGLLHLRRGHEERGALLYEEAVRLALNASDKARIRQKMHLEIAQLKSVENPSMARRHLERAISIAGGAPELTEQARKMRAALSRLSP